jgi:hypothetical protein
MTELSLELFLSIFLPITFFLFGLVLTYLRSIDKTTNNIGTIVGIVDKERIIANYEKVKSGLVPSGGNGAPAHEVGGQLSEKDQLLQRLKDGTISPDEARRLHAILEQEAANARAAGALGAFLAILGLLALIALLSERR